MRTSKGFTLIELLLVIGIIAILAAIVIVAINPTKQLGDARDAQRRSDVNTLLNAVWQYAIDFNGSMPDNNGTAAGGQAVDTTVRMLGTATAGCSAASVCTKAGTTVGADSCLDLTSALAGNYLVSIPQDPRFGSAALSRYIVWTSGTSNRVSVRACEPEIAAAGSISVTR